ncbi:probable lysosomal cobalamin transporter [Mya arenaria]|uniref:probable lysosomal cobalamin transporter n=1 Tax=Mya arenaria TaxID=6604 RepID=UPI0022E6C26D|nr:probable lysosomal cobalamin transporter [Mya arenaria]
MSVHIPSSVLAAGWIPFVVVIVAILVFSIVYILYYTNRREREWSSAISAIVSLSITLMTIALIPVDVFLVSFMKNGNGTFKDWAQDNDTRISLENSVLYGYYTMYGMITFCMFILLPFMYFFYEEREEEATCKSRCCGALKYSIVFFILMFVLLLVGALLHTKQVDNPGNKTQSDIDRLMSLFDMESNWVERSLSLALSVLSLIGMLAVIFYTSYGMASLPIGLIKGHRNVRKERLGVQDRRANTRDRMQAIRNKYLGGKRVSRRDASRLAELEESEVLMERQDRHLEARDTCCQRLFLVLRPFAVMFGILLILVATTVFLSLLLTNIDKTLANGLGPKSGYALKKPTLPNVVDIVLVFCQQVFPLDYIVFGLLALYLVFSSMTGIRDLGIWFFCLRMYKMRPRRTPPQGILMMCFILMLTLLGINILLYELTPQYTSFGNQHYWTTAAGTNTSSLVRCSYDSTDNRMKDECVATRMSMLLTRIFYNMWFFGAAYYWSTWLFLLCILIGFLVAICRKSRSAIDGEVDADDIVDSDDEELLSG